MKILSKIINSAAALAQKTGGGVSGSREVSKEMIALARRAAAEGIVLLKNNNDALPVRPDETVAVFGRVQYDWFYVGYGSGGDVKPPYRINLIEGLENADVRVDGKLKDIYGKWCRKNVPDEGFWGHWPYNFKEMPLSDDVIDAAGKRADKAIIVIGRAAGEDREQKLKKGSFYLTDAESDMIAKVISRFEKTIVVINNGNVMDMSWTEKFGDKISALLYAWQGGMESGNAVADVIAGNVNPSGKLPVSIAKNYEDYPSSDNFGGKDFNDYKEDIYVGYRYFETFAKDKVLYPFGSGLSYTSFSYDGFIRYDGNGYFVEATIKNEGNKDGKETLAVYVEPPQGVIGKPMRVLASFVKSKIIPAREEENVTIEIPLDNLYSYDDCGISGYPSSYVLESGNYKVYIGTNVRESKIIGTFCIDKTVVKHVKPVCPVKSDFEIIYPKYAKDGECIMGTRLAAKAKRDIKDRILGAIPEPLVKRGMVNFREVLKGEKPLDDFVAQLTLAELETLTHGDYRMNSRFGASGNAGAFGGISESLIEKGVPQAITTDGPSGVRLMTYASLLPCGTAIAATFNEELTQKLYAEVGREMIEKGSDILLAPGMNIHRNPLCGRNFEYFSEDPVLTGMIASAVVKGLQSTGVSACPKHFACNNQEKNRLRNDSRVSERALREIYLKGFELVVKNAKPEMIMTSYNKINGVWSCYNYDLCTEILRNEWGFEGIVTTDWWNLPDRDHEFENIYNNAYRVRAGNDVLMPGGNRTNGKYDRSAEASVNENGLTRQELEICAKRVLNFLLTCPATAKKIK